MNPLVAVVIPCYNYGEYIEEAVESVLNSSFQDYEIIIVDDGSTDLYTLRVLDNMKLKPKTKVIHRQNGGLSAARNTGFTNTNAKYVMTLDADDRIHPTFIEKGVWLLENKPSISFVYSLVQLFGDYTNIWDTLPYNFNYLKFRNVIPATIIIRRTVWEESNGYDESMREGYEDWEFILRIGEKGKVGYHINQVLFYYRKHRGSMLSASKLKHKDLIKQIKYRNPEIYKSEYFQFMRFIFMELIRQLKRKGGQIVSNQINRFGYKKIIKRIYYSLFQPKLNDISPPVAPVSTLYRNESNKKNILIILPWLEVGGVEKVFFQIISNLSKNYNFVLVTTKAGSSHPWESIFQPFVKAIYHIGGFGTGENDQLLFLNHLIRVHQICILHISNSQFAYRGFRFIKSQNPGIQIIDTLHMEEPWSGWDYFQYSIHFAEYIDVTTTLTNSQKLRLNDSIKGKHVEVIPNGTSIIDDSNIFEKDKKDYYTIGLIGRLSEQKQPIFFLELAKESKKHNLPFRFLIVGDGELKNKLIQLIDKWGLHDFVELEGFTNEVNLKFSQIDILCAPSKREGLPMIGLEAMNFGIPIVASRVSGWTDLIEDNVSGFLCDNSTKEFIDKFKILLDNTIYMQIVRNAKRAIENTYSLEAMINRYENLYEKVNVIKNES